MTKYVFIDDCFSPTCRHSEILLIEGKGVFLLIEPDRALSHFFPSFSSGLAKGVYKEISRTKGTFCAASSPIGWRSAVIFERGNFYEHIKKSID